MSALSIIFPSKQFGPVYPDMGATVAKYRRKAAAAGSIAAMLPADRRAYGDAVEREIHAKNNAWWRAGAHVNAPPAQYRGSVGDAVRRAQHAALAACPGKERRARTDAVWLAMYEAAMAAKRKRAEAPAVSPTAPTPNAAFVAGAKLTPIQKAWATRRANAARAA